MLRVLTGSAGVFVWGGLELHAGQGSLTRKDFLTLSMLWHLEAFQVDGCTVSRAKRAQFGLVFRPRMRTPDHSLEQIGGFSA